MRRASILTCAVCVVGCYAAHAPTGAPCDPGLENCPAGQRCTPQAGGYVCLPPDAVDDAGIATIDGPIDSAMMTMPDAQSHFVFPAAIAECIEPSMPSTAQCRQREGNEQLLVDGQDDATMEPWHAFVRFDLGNALAGRTITSVSLRMVATSATYANSSSSGEVWQVQPFSLSSLSTQAPAQVGTRLAPTQGAVTQLQTVSWSLPTSIVPTSGPIHLGVFPTVDDGVNYWNSSGTTPPTLVVDAL